MEGLSEPRCVGWEDEHDACAGRLFVRGDVIMFIFLIKRIVVQTS